MNFSSGIKPNMVTFVTFLPICGAVGDKGLVTLIHGSVVKVGLNFEVCIGNALVDAYGKCWNAKDSKPVFNEMVEKNEVGLTPDSITISSMIPVLFELEIFNLAKEIHGFNLRIGIQHDVFISNSLIDMYAKSGHSSAASNVFHQMNVRRNVVSWNAMVSNFAQNRLEFVAMFLLREMQAHGYLQTSDWSKSVSLFSEMGLTGYGMLGELNIAISFFEALKKDGIEYDSVSYIAILSACSHGGLLEKRRKYSEEMKAQKIKPTQMHYACMVDLLGRAGLLEEAEELIKSLPIIPDANIWGALLGACRIFRNLELECWAAENLFKLKPQHSRYYTILSNIFAEARKWDEANRIRELMKLSLSIYLSIYVLSFIFSCSILEIKSGKEDKLV
ncbi:hypothetical protein CRYUN_Cryun03dG0125400 [Craigia yunnanensis]